MSGIELAGIAVHPVKSTAIRHVRRAEVQPWGLAGDRRWMVVDRDGALVTARELHELFTITADTPETDPPAGTALRLSAEGHDPLDVTEPGADTALVPVRLFKHELLARPADDAATAWVREVLGRDDLRLVWCDEPARRSLNPSYSKPGDHTAFADGYPVTLASLDSLRRLNDWMVEDALLRGEEPTAPLPVERFRPNLVVSGADPFAEDGWTGVRVGDVTFRKAKGVDRCVMTTISLLDLTTGKEPIRTLARHRLHDHKTWFAVHLIPESTGAVQVGDEVFPS